MERLSKSQLSSLWEKLCRNPNIQALGYKVEIQANGHLIMSPGNFRHSLLQAEVVKLLLPIPGGRPSTETAIETSRGMLVPDVCWCSTPFIERFADQFSVANAPEICVEIMSPSNSLTEMEEKRDAYFKAGCEEFILVDTKGFVTFHISGGQAKQCTRLPDFPLKIEL